MKLILTEDDGTVLDTLEEVSREDLEKAKSSGLVAVLMLQELNPGGENENS